MRSEIRVRVRVGGLYLEWVKRENQVLSLDSELNEVMVYQGQQKGKIRVK